MSKENIKIGCRVPFIGFLGAVITATIGQSIHHSFWWGIVDFFCWPLVWAKWIICRDVNLTLIRDCFSWFLN